jgi:hypothetical protein
MVQQQQQQQQRRVPVAVQLQEEGLAGLAGGSRCRVDTLSKSSQCQVDIQGCHNLSHGGCAS